MDTHDRTRRHDTLAGLRELLDMLAGHMGLPVPTTITVDVHADNDLDGFELVARAAHHLDVAVLSSPSGVQRAARDFGPVTYAVVYIPQHPKEKIR